jgi:hypothetical protein
MAEGAREAPGRLTVDQGDLSIRPCQQCRRIGVELYGACSVNVWFVESQPFPFTVPVACLVLALKKPAALIVSLLIGSM